MKRTVFAMTAALIIATAPMGLKNDARAQGLVEYALILVVVSISSDEALDLLWYPDGNRGRSDSPGFGEVTFAVSVNGGEYSGQRCRQSVQAKVGVRVGVNQLRIETNADNQALIFNDGEVVAPLNTCFINASNLVVELGVPVPPDLALEIEGRGPMPAPRGMKKPFIAAATVRAADGSTAAVQSYLANWDEGLILLDIP